MSVDSHNYRIVHRHDLSPASSIYDYVICTIFYDEKGNIEDWWPTAEIVSGSSVAAIKKELTLFQAACNFPVLELSDLPPVQESPWGLHFLSVNLEEEERECSLILNILAEKALAAPGARKASEQRRLDMIAKWNTTASLKIDEEKMSNGS